LAVTMKSKLMASVNLMVTIATIAAAATAVSAGLWPPLCLAAAPAAQLEPIVQHVQDWYDKLSDLQADFRQKSFSQTLNTTTEAKGKLYFKKPNLMKWDYESPEKQLYVINQKDFFWYVPEDAQVVKRKASTVLQDTTPLSFLAGLGNLRQSFIISLPDEGAKPNDSAASIILLNLLPKRAQASMKKMQLKLKAQSLEISGIILIDPYGNTNEIDFFNVRLNQGLSESIFRFTPPKGVDVIEEDLPPNAAEHGEAASISH